MLSPRFFATKCGQILNAVVTCSASRDTLFLIMSSFFCKSESMLSLWTFGFCLYEVLEMFMGVYAL
jgi:hypothetical protein